MFLDNFHWRPRVMRFARILDYELLGLLDEIAIDLLSEQVGER